MSKFCQKKVMSSLVIRKIMVPGEDGSRTEESSKTSYGGKCGKKGKKKIIMNCPHSFFEVC